MSDDGPAPVKKAMVLAAGLGLRLRPLTDARPKPLIAVAGRTMLDRALDHLAAHGVEHAVVNSHYLAGQIEAHLAKRRVPRIRISYEQTLLETGGGIANALSQLGPAPFFAVNADIVWSDGASPALAGLAGRWDDAAMDALLLVHPRERAVGYDGKGDFRLRPSGALVRRAGGESAPFVFTGVQLLHPRLFAGAPTGAFSMNILYDRALAAGRLFGLAHDGGWYHVGTPEALRTVEMALAEAAGGPGRR